jgi:hypothetical protein
MPASLALEFERSLVPFRGEAVGAFLRIVDLVPPDESASPAHELVEFLVVPVVGIAFGASFGRLLRAGDPFVIALVAMAYSGVGHHAEDVTAFGTLVGYGFQHPHMSAVGAFVLSLYRGVVAGGTASGAGLRRFVVADGPEVAAHVAVQLLSVPGSIFTHLNTRVDWSIHPYVIWIVNVQLQITSNFKKIIF